MCAIIDQVWGTSEQARGKYNSLLGIDSYEEGYGDHLVLMTMDTSMLKDFACCKTLSVMVSEKRMEHEPSMIPGHPNETGLVHFYEKADNSCLNNKRICITNKA